MKIEHYAGLNFWKAASDETRSTVQIILEKLVAAHGNALVESFYSAFLAHEDGRFFLNHDVVQNRLSKSMENWLHDLVKVDLTTDLTDFAAVQAKIGAIHGRMKLPNHLVQQGGSQLKSHLSRIIAEQYQDDSKVLAATLIIFDELMDFALCLMSRAYVQDARERAQTDEAFRHFALGQDINLERETQRAALMEWSQSALFNLLGDQNSQLPQKLAASAFGLWMRHRAAMLFHDDAVLDAIDKAMKAIDNSCLPQLADKPDDRSALMKLKERIEEISFLLNDLFQAAAAIENGRDPLTRTLNRRFLPSVLNREISMSKALHLPLSIAMIDLDHFKQVNDRYGHGAGDQVLRHMAEQLLKSVRSNDFIFRYGGEEFLIVFPETDAELAKDIVERLRADLERSSISISGHGEIGSTISAGVAQFDGHPDYEYLIGVADRALYEAKRAGRNQVVVEIA